MFAKILLVIFVSVSVFAKEVILDVRTPKEFKSGHLPGAINIDVKNENFKDKVKNLNKADQIRIYCRSGARSAQAMIYLNELGFENVENLGGFEDAKEKLKGAKTSP